MICLLMTRCHFGTEYAEKCEKFQPLVSKIFILSPFPIYLLETKNHSHRKYTLYETPKSVKCNYPVLCVAYLKCDEVK